jgi:hypothetical protein
MKKKPERAISKSSLRARRIGKILKILHEVEAMPSTWLKGSNAWKKRIAIKHGVALQSIYRWYGMYKKSGISGLEHRKSNVGKSKIWTPEALDFWIGLVLLPQKRDMTLKALYQDCLIIEAQIRGWRVGCWSSASGWVRKKAMSLIENKP